jgi:hypothetical protein
MRWGTVESGQPWAERMLAECELAAAAPQVGVAIGARAP